MAVSVPKMAKSLRSTMTKQEVKLWAQLKGYRGRGYHFRRQAVLQNYIVNFVCFAVIVSP